MKIKKGFIMKKMADKFVVIAIGEAAKKFSGYFTLNETGAFLFENIKAGITREELLEKLTSEYDVDEKTACEDINEFVAKLKEINAIEE